jgi:hypothetical protein
MKQKIKQYGCIFLIFLCVFNAIVVHWGSTKMLVDATFFVFFSFQLAKVMAGK